MQKKTRLAPLRFRVLHGVVDTLIGPLLVVSVIMVCRQLLGLPTRPAPDWVTWSMLPGLALYRWAFVVMLGGTFAHGITSCRVQSENGGQLSRAQAWSRAWRYFVPWDIFTYKDGLFDHDRHSGTKLVVVPRPKLDPNDRWLS